MLLVLHRLATWCKFTHTCQRPLLLPRLALDACTTYSWVIVCGPPSVSIGTSFATSMHILAQHAVNERICCGTRYYNRAVMGPSGSGKTSLLNCLAHKNSSYTGQILLNGKPASANTVARFSGFVQQVYHPFHTLHDVQHIHHESLAESLQYCISAHVFYVHCRKICSYLLSRHESTCSLPQSCAWTEACHMKLSKLELKASSKI
jgi:ABC-type dipeptide/oligopeptide/nickel transport system ATPase subunit